MKNPGLDVRGEFWTHTHDVVALVKRMWVLAELKIWRFETQFEFRTFAVKDFFQSYQNYNFEYAKKKQEQCHSSHRSKVLGPWSTIYPNLGLVDYQACPGLERHGSAGGHHTPPNIFKSQYFHIETHSFGLQQKSHGKMHPARSPFSELYRGLNKLSVLVICFLPAIFCCFWKVGFKDRFEGIKDISAM